MLSDIEIARQSDIYNIEKIAKKIGLKKDNLICYGNNMAKININSISDNKKGKLILVSAMSPTKAGEGKTTISIGLADALNSLKKKTMLALRQPSLGPVFGIKGGATGGGYSQVIPMEDINLHFTGDFHAITSANNLLSAIIDNHIHQGNELKIKKVFFERCIDLNDRALKEITVGKGRQDKFTITSASEIMSILSLATNLSDLKRRLGNILVGQDENGKLIYAKDLKANDAMTILLKDAIKPNLVQTLEHTPTLIHCGPFANIAHGCNSIIATKTAINLADYVVTEAGFGADLGGEKFLDLKCQLNNLKPSCVVLVATCKALKLHGGQDYGNINTENINALNTGLKNLERHILNIKNVYNLPVVVAINKFSTDTDNEIECVKTFVQNLGVNAISTECHTKGSKGSIELARAVIEKCEENSNIQFAYDLNDDTITKINKIATKIYGGKGVVLTDHAQEMLKIIEDNKYEKLPVVIAKTQYSFSDNKDLLNAPSDFDITITDFKIRAGAEFIVAIAGKMLLMPGLAKHSAYENMTIDENGKIDGLF